MSKKLSKQIEIPKVIPLTEEKRHVIASDQKSQRLILGIGQQRIVFDLFTRVTRLPPHTPSKRLFSDALDLVSSSRRVLKVWSPAAAT